MMKKLLPVAMLAFFVYEPVQALELEDRLDRAEQLADLTNAFASRCENDIKHEEKASTEDCDNFLETHALWAEADKSFQSLYSDNGRLENTKWKAKNEYRLKAYKHLLHRTKRTAIKINGMIRKIP